MEPRQVISLAEVRDTVDVNRNGSFLARIAALGNTEERINYVSPYATNQEGAFIAIPEVGTQILVCQPTSTSEWYYLGATFSPEPGQVEGDLIPDAEVYPMARADHRVYDARGVPMRQSFKGANGGGLTMSEEYNPTFISKKTELHSEVNKKVSLVDSPAIDSIILDSGNGSKITLSDNPQNQSIPARAVQVESVGPQKYINVESQTDIVVIDGRELQVLNNSTGSNAPEDSPSRSGNVNIQSKWKDVNIFTQAKEGRIFIECLNTNGNNQVIQIETNGGQGDTIVIKTKGDIRLDAGGNIDMKAGGQIRMESGGTYSINSGGSLEVNSTGTANIEAPTVNLANGAAPSPPVVTGQQSYYGNEGVTTY